MRFPGISAGLGSQRACSVAPACGRSDIADGAVSVTAFGLGDSVSLGMISELDEVVTTALCRRDRLGKSDESCTSEARASFIRWLPVFIFSLPPLGSGYQENQNEKENADRGGEMPLIEIGHLRPGTPSFTAIRKDRLRDSRRRCVIA